jgi:hypothetical protein
VVTKERPAAGSAMHAREEATGSPELASAVGQKAYFLQKMLTVPGFHRFNSGSGPKHPVLL